MHMATVAGALSDVDRRRIGQTNTRKNFRDDCSVEQPFPIRIPKNESGKADRPLYPFVVTIRLDATFALVRLSPWCDFCDDAARHHRVKVLGTKKIGP